jgi:hypothetical protein
VTVGLIQCGSPKKDKKKSSENIEKQKGSINHPLLKILPDDPYLFNIQFQQDSIYKFRLWFPELAIFDCDSSRALTEDVSNGDWVEENQDGFIIFGKIGDNELKINFKYHIMAFSEKAVKLELEIENAGKLPWSDYAQLAVCLAPVGKTFSDTIGDRTYIHIGQNRLKSIAETSIVNSFNHYPVSPRSDSADLDQRIQLASGFVSRLSVEKQSVISFLWDKSARVDVNPGGLDCIHSHPAIGPLEPGGIIERTGFIVLTKTDVEQNFNFSRNLIDQSTSP